MIPANISQYLIKRAISDPWEIAGPVHRTFAGAVLIPALAESSRLFTTLRSLAENPPELLDRFLVLDVPWQTASPIWRREAPGRWRIVFDTLTAVKPEDLLRTVTIRGEPHSVMQAVNRQMAHYGLHIGQIVFLAKHLSSESWKPLTIPKGRSQDFNQRVARGEASQR